MHGSIRMSWEKIVDLYPDKWVALKNIKLENGEIVSGEFLAALSNNGMRKFKAAHNDPEIMYYRTSSDYEMLDPQA